MPIMTLVWKQFGDRKLMVPKDPKHLTVFQHCCHNGMHAITEKYLNDYARSVIEAHGFKVEVEAE